MHEEFTNLRIYESTNLRIYRVTKSNQEEKG